MKTKKSMLLFLVLLFSCITVSAQSANITQGQEVDLGLSVNWAGWNVGATSPEQYGDYYAWGTTIPIEEYILRRRENSYDQLLAQGLDISGTQYDVARQKWGGTWRMPTKAEFDELISKCTWTSITYKGVLGVKLTGPNGNSIFLPAAGFCDVYYDKIKIKRSGVNGYYLSATRIDYEFANNLCILSGIDDIHSIRQVRLGQTNIIYKLQDGESVRPVKNKGTVKKATSSKPSTQRSQNKTNQNSEIDYNKMSTKELQDRIRELQKDGVTSAERREILKITEIIGKRLKGSTVRGGIVVTD